MNGPKLMKVTYYDPNNNIRLTGYSDTVVWDEKGQPTLTALRFGGYPEEVRGLADAIFGGITIEIESEGTTLTLKTLRKQYQREISHDGVYAEATLIAEDDGQLADGGVTHEDGEQEEAQTQQDLPPRNTYIFCTPGDRADLFRAVDQKTVVPLIPEFRDYVLDQLMQRNILRPLRVRSRIPVQVPDNDRHHFQTSQLTGPLAPVSGHQLIAAALPETGDSRHDNAPFPHTLHSLFHGIIVLHREGVVREGMQLRQRNNLYPLQGSVLAAFLGAEQIICRCQLYFFRAAFQSSSPPASDFCTQQPPCRRGHE